MVQGLTEFLPVSSSAHLVFIQHLLGLTDSSIAFDVLLHVGTLVAVVVYFFKDMRYEEVVFVKNNSTFTILTTVPSENYNDEKQSFETILDSIHVQ